MSDPVLSSQIAAGAVLSDLIVNTDAAKKIPDFVAPALSKAMIDALSPKPSNTVMALLANSYAAKHYLSPSFALPVPPRLKSNAEAMYERLVQQIKDFEGKLDPGEEIGGRLVSAPGIGVFHIEDLEYRVPDMIIFHGKNEYCRPVQLLQHCSQLNLLLSALPKEKDTPRRIGFMLERKLPSTPPPE